MADQLPWWSKDAHEPHAAIKSTIERIRSADSDRQRSLLRFARMYGGREIAQLDAPSFHRRPGSAMVLKYNLAKSVVKAWVAKIARSRPRGLFLTVEGDYGLQKRAKKMTRFLDGEFARGHVYEETTACALDAGVMGTGCLKVFEGPREADKPHGLLTYERVFPWELWVDPIEGFYGKPRSLFQIQSVDRHVLAAAFPKHRAEILDRHKTGAASLGLVLDTTADLVDVFEAWHLPSSPEAGDGRHVICTASCTLNTDTAWTRPRFPFAFFRYEKPLAGFWGDGLVENVMPQQYEINLCLEKLQACLALVGTPRVYLARGSKIVESHINDKVGQIIYYSGGVPPVIDVSASVPPELPGHIAQLKQDAFEAEGIDRYFAQGRKPEGLDSGRAIRTHEAIETGRQIVPSRAYEDFVMDVAQLAVELVEEISERDGGYRVAAHDHRSVEIIDWSDVRLETEQYHLRVFPTSLLPTQPQAKLAAVQELVEAGWIGREDGMRLLDFPDLEAYTSLECAAYEVIDMVIERALDFGEYVPPEPYFPLEWGRARVQMAYNRARMQDGIPSEHLEQLQRWIADATALLEPDEPIGGAMPPAPMGQPGPEQIPPETMAAGVPPMA